MELIKFVFSNFFIFCGFFLILALIFEFIFKLINRILRHRNIRKFGYPPEWCDADGDFKKTDEDDD